MATDNQKARADRQNIFSLAFPLLDPERIFGQFEGLRERFQPLFEQEFARSANQEGLIAAQAGNAVQAGLGRAGLGNTGLGASLSAGLTRGAAFGASRRNSQLRLRFLDDLRRQAEASRNLEFTSLMNVAGGINTTQQGGNSQPGANAAMGALRVGGHLAAAFPPGGATIPGSVAVEVAQ